MTVPDVPPARHDPGGPTPRSRRARRLVAVSIATTIGLGAVGVVGTGAYLAHRLDSNIERVADPFAPLPSRAPESDSTATNILLVGSDSRISDGDPSVWRPGAQRTDAIMLVHLPGDRQGAYVLSIPRDSWVTIPGHGQAKVNAAYSLGGAPLLIQTIEQLTGVRIHHLAIADFASFADLTDALGGVEITVPESTYWGDTLIAREGTYVMDGEQALAYVHQRHGLPGGDFDRIKRQQNWLRAIADKAVESGVLIDPAVLVRFLGTVSRSVAVDEGLSLWEMTQLAAGMRDLRPNAVEFLTVPVLGTGWSPDGTESIVRLDDDALDALSAAVRADEVRDYLEAHVDDVEFLGDIVR